MSTFQACSHGRLMLLGESRCCPLRVLSYFCLITIILSVLEDDKFFGRNVVCAVETLEGALARLTRL